MRTALHRSRVLAVVLAAAMVIVASGCTIDAGLAPGTNTTTGAEINGNGVITAWGSTLAGIRGFIKEPGHDWVNIGTVGDASTLPEAINDSKVVVGAIWKSIDFVTVHHPFRWDPVGGIKDLGSLGGQNGEATDINNGGTIVGWSTLAGPGGVDGPQQAWYSNPAAPSTLIPLPSLSGNPPSYAAGINDKGDIVGWVYLSGQAHAVMWLAGTHQIVDIGPPGVGSEAHDVNNDGVASGQVMENIYVIRPARWLAGTHQVDYIGTLGIPFGCGNAINDAGVIVGSDGTATGRHAFRWDPKTRVMTDLGVLGGTDSHAAGLNQAGQIIGWSNIDDVLGDGSHVNHAVEWTPDAAPSSPG